MMEIIQRIKNFIGGVNKCPICKKETNKTCFGYTEYLCGGCFRKAIKRIRENEL